MRERLLYIFYTNKFNIIVVVLVILDLFFVIVEFFLDMNIIEVFDYRGGVEFVLKILYYFSFVIFSVFIVEIFVKLYVYRLSFFRYKMEVFDVVIVIVFFIFDIIFRNKEGFESGVGLLVILRLWRVIRIFNGKFMWFIFLGKM